jgi:hypothetical protein
MPGDVPPFMTTTMNRIQKEVPEAENRVGHHVFSSSQRNDHLAKHVHRPAEPSEEMSDMRGIGIKSVAGAALLLCTGLAQAQTTPTPPESTPPAATKPDTAKVTLTEDQAKSWIDKRVFSSDGKELGEVAAFKRAADNTVLEMHADIGGLLGIGETRVSVMPAQFKLENDRVILTLTEQQAKALPQVKN